MKIRSRIALLIVVLFILGTGTIAAYQSHPKTVTVIDGGKVTQYETVDVLVEEFLTSENIQLNEKDNLSIDSNTSITDGMEITITRWNPTVTMILDQKETKVKTKAYTVEQFLKEQDISLGEKDVVEPSRATDIVEGITISISTEKTITETKKEVIPYKTEVRKTSNLKAGEQMVEQVGVNGIKENIYKVTTFNGEVVSEALIESNNLVDVQTEIILEGIKNVVVDPKTGKSYEFTKELAMEATAYTDIPNDRWYGVTASGLPTFVGMVAVDKKVIPLGTKLYVEGYGIAYAGDTGGAVKGNIIDLYMSTQKEVKAFGRRPRQVYILKDQGIDVRAERKVLVAQK